MDSAHIKRIDIQRRFANATFKNFTALRYGLTPCCIVDMDSAAIDKQMCDWQELSTMNYTTLLCNPETITQNCTTETGSGSTTNPEDALKPSFGGDVQTLYFATTTTLKAYIATLSGSGYRFQWVVDDDDGFGPANGFYDGTDLHYNVAIII